MLSTSRRPVAGAGRLLRRSAFAMTLAGAVAAGVALPAAAASAATPSPVPVADAAPASSLPAPAGTATPVPAPATRAPRSQPPRGQGAPGQGRALPVQPRGGVDTGAGGTAPDTHDGTGLAVPLAAGGVGLGALAGVGLWRRRRVGALR